MNKYRVIIILLFCLVLPLQAGAKELTFTVLYNNDAGVPGTIADWGFSCLVQGGDKTTLFDTGAD
jgi:7,8-dihydropterin-6-yl-methyl-4-(beta-D-ribofuranosyl)aminobenzene 5'-phosphate synthase